MQLPPESVIASWPKPNYVDYQARGSGLLIVNVVFSALATILVALRIYTRLRITATFGLDDIFSLLALVRTFLFCKILSFVHPFLANGANFNLASSNCDVRSLFHCREKLRLGPSYLGRASYVAANDIQAHNGLSNHFLSGITVYKALPAVVLSSYSWSWDQRTIPNLQLLPHCSHGRGHIIVSHPYLHHHLSVHVCPPLRL